MISEQAVIYASLVLFDGGVELSADNLKKVCNAAGLTDIEPFWFSMVARSLGGADLNEVLSKVGTSGPAAAPAAAAGRSAPAQIAAAEKVEEKEESDIDMGGGGLFGDDEEDW